MASARKKSAGTVCRIEGEMTVYRAAELKPVLLQAARDGAAPALDLSAVTEIDTAGVQLLLLARSVAAARGVPLHLPAASAVVRDTLAFLGIGEALE